MHQHSVTQWGVIIFLYQFAQARPHNVLHFPVIYISVSIYDMPYPLGQCKWNFELCTLNLCRRISGNIQVDMHCNHVNLVMYRHNSWEDCGFTPNLPFNPVFTKFNSTEFLHTSLHHYRVFVTHFTLQLYLRISTNIYKYLRTQFANASLYVTQFTLHFAWDQDIYPWKLLPIQSCQKYIPSPSCNTNYLLS